MRIAFMLTLIASVAGCMSLPPESRIPLRADELAQLKSHKDIVLTNVGDMKGCKQNYSASMLNDQYGFCLGSLRNRIIVYAKSLRLTPAEFKALSAGNNVTICGKCGNLKGGPSCCVASEKMNSRSGYAKDSLLDRMLGYPFKTIVPVTVKTQKTTAATAK